MDKTMPEAVASAINTVMGSVGYIQKKGENKFHNYKFTAIEDVMAKLQPAMAEAGLVVIQDELAHGLIAGDAVMTATYAFRLVHKSGMEWDGQARHTGMAAAKNSKGGFDDKALNKCHTAARKYFLMALFQIPTGTAADPDADEAPPPAEAANAGERHATIADDLNAQRDRALMWAEASAKKLDAMTRLSDVVTWETKNAETLEKLRDVDFDTWKTMKQKLAGKTAALEQKEAA